MIVRRRGAGVLVALALTACGTTVPQSVSAPAAASAVPVSDLAPGQPGAQPTSMPIADQEPTAVGGGTHGAGTGGPAQAVGPQPSMGSGSRPAAAIATPLTVGVVFVDTGDTNSALGVSSSASVTPKSAARALIKGINARGGLAGRRLVAVEYGFNGNSANYDQDASEACTTFTQDHHVAVVLDFAFGSIGGFRACLQKAHVLDITTGSEGDSASSRRAALHLNTAHLTTDRAYSSVLLGSVHDGYLTRTSQLGIIVEGCPEDLAAYTKTIRPLIGQLGLHAPSEAELSCTRGFADAGPAASAISNAILQFRQANVDRVMLVSGFEQTVLLLFAEAADSQGYRPGYALSSSAQVAALRPSLPSGQWPGLQGIGNIPGNDTDGSGARPSSVDSRCLDLSRAGGLAPATDADKVGVFGECAAFLLLGQLLTSTRGVSTATTLDDAATHLGTSFDAPGLLEGADEVRSRPTRGPYRGPGLRVRQLMHLHALPRLADGGSALAGETDADLGSHAHDFFRVLPVGRGAVAPCAPRQRPAG